MKKFHMALAALLITVGLLSNASPALGATASTTIGQTANQTVSVTTSLVPSSPEPPDWLN